MFNWCKHRFFEFWQGFRDWINGQDACEVCGEEIAGYTCVGCERRICGSCDVGYYADAEICEACRREISPEEEAEDMKDSANNMAESCTCPKTMWNGVDPINASCELDDNEHAFIAKYASASKE